MRPRNPLVVRMVLALALLAPALLQAQDEAPAAAPFRVTITNLTRSQIFAPPIAITHSREYRLFETGAPASPALAAMAEDGALDLLMDDLAADPAVFDFAAAGGPLMPGASVSIEVDARFPYDHVTVAQMLVSTNDAFFALDGVVGPRGNVKTGTYHVGAYDAGSEFNSESCATIPGPPCGNAGVRDTANAEGYVYVHSGIHGDGDLDAALFDWRNPVAKITIVRLPRR